MGFGEGRFCKYLEKLIFEAIEDEAGKLTL